MRKQYFFVSLLALTLSVPGSLSASMPNVGDDGGVVVTLGVPQIRVASAQTPNTSKMVINGTGQSATFTLNAQNLVEDIILTATSGLEVYPETLPVGSAGETITVTLKSTLPLTTGKIIIRSGDARAYVDVTGYGTALKEKSLSQSPIYVGTGDDETFVHGKGDGFVPGNEGYTIEFRVKTDNLNKTFDAYAVTEANGSLKAYVNSASIGLYNGSDKIAIPNPATDVEGGLKSFYNNDGKYHTYRFAVTSDQRIFAYRDGLPIGTFRASDFGAQSAWGIENGDLKENLLKNPNFEGEYNNRSSDSLMIGVEGWQIGPIDQYNCTFSVPNIEINKELDIDNHAIKLQRYTWNDGWAAGTVSQIVDVAPNETYSLSFLARGGQKIKNDAVEKVMGDVRIEEVQNSDLRQITPITSPDNFETYSMDFTTSARCRQIRVSVYQERFLDGGGWGSSVRPLIVDDMKLTGMSRVLDQKVGFDNSFSDVEYFSYDPTGAYAPLEATLNASEESVVINGTNQSKTVKISSKNLRSDEPLTVTATSGFSVYPEELLPNQDADLIITLNSTLETTEGAVYLRSGDKRTTIQLTGYGTALEEKDLSKNPSYTGTGDDESYVQSAEAGFTPGEDGYTIEFRIKTDNLNKAFDAYAITEGGAGLKTYVNSTSVGLYDGTNRIDIPNPATAGEGGLKQFYNNDGKYHTYRFAVTSDQRIFAYRDGLPIGTFRASDFGGQADWGIENGDLLENMLKNSDFEGEWNAREDGLVTQVEGWQLGPIDQYNCTFSVPNLEVNNALDINNHAIKLQRYTWNDGWAAGSVSQIVDVAPNETYSLSFLARGGQKIKDDAVEKVMGDVRIEEVQNSDLRQITPITSVDDFETYSMDFTTSAQCRQIRVSVYQERFLDGGGWGASVRPLIVDEMKLSGISRVLDQKAGFDNTFSDIEYFTVDPTGAYAPMLSQIGGVTGIEDKNADNANAVYGRVADNWLFLDNVSDTAKVEVYNASGMLVLTENNYTSGQAISLPQKGVYICIIDDGGNRHTLKVVY